MLWRAAATATLNGHAAAWFRRLLTRSRPVTPIPPAHLGRHRPQQAQLHPTRADTAPPLPLPRPCGSRGYSYRRMARRIPIARPDGYSSSDGEAEEPDAREAGEVTEPVGAGAEGDDNSEGSEVEGFMLDLSSFPGLGDADGDEEGTKEEGKGSSEAGCGELANRASSWGKGRSPGARGNAHMARV